MWYRGLYTFRGSSQEELKSIRKYRFFGRVYVRGIENLYTFHFSQGGETAVVYVLFVRKKFTLEGRS